MLHAMPFEEHGQRLLSIAAATGVPAGVAEGYFSQYPQAVPTDEEAMPRRRG
jgi:hypothetical protein